ncbi:hypothetical protein AVEN_55907-1 [Araneus ventricosus]|uniref:Uncharacterized protein n=1 Tax=Araneus ventricosus TaxID=182803 RepID=A0A4Y2LNS6_ARAVE|nr:hypothetical protein AVEN_55907-1 [Araneus ventricosus]
MEKEEHLSPPPYQTRCRDNRPSKDAKDSTNPGSYEVKPSKVEVLTQNMASSVGERGEPLSSSLPDEMQRQPTLKRCERVHQP